MNRAERRRRRMRAIERRTQDIKNLSPEHVACFCYGDYRTRVLRRAWHPKGFFAKNSIIKREIKGYWGKWSDHEPLAVVRRRLGFETKLLDEQVVDIESAAVQEAA